MIGENEPPSGWAGWMIVTLIGGIGAVWTVLVAWVKRGITKEEKQHEETLKLHAVAIDELKTDNAELKKRSDDCEKDRADIRVRLAKAETKLELLTPEEPPP